MNRWRLGETPCWRRVPLPPPQLPLAHLLVHAVRPEILRRSARRRGHVVNTPGAGLRWASGTALGYFARFRDPRGLLGGWNRLDFTSTWSTTVTPPLVVVVAPHRASVGNTLPLTFTFALASCCASPIED